MVNKAIYHHIWGNGKAILLVHGWAMDSSAWTYFIEEFSTAYKVIAVDLRGHGKSASLPGPYNIALSALDVEKLIEDLDLQKATVIGWSMGVSVILKMFEHPNSRIDSLVFISGTPSLIARDDYPHGVPRAEAYSLLRQLKKDYAVGMTSFYDRIFSGEDLGIGEREKIYHLVADISRAPRQDIACEALESLQREDLRLSLKNITVPTLLIHGGLDRICLPAASEYMAGSLPNSVLAIIAAAGHAPFLTAKETVHREIKKFIQHVQ
jgi:pimeloyl-[acyl-carrier protein] methyl ester esterase